MQYPTPPHRPQAYRPPVAGLRQYVVRGKPAKTDRLRALLTLFSEPQIAPHRRRS